MNPAEWMRSVTHRVDDDGIAIEAAEALAAFARQPGLVVACRRLLEHHRGLGVLWWVCSNVLTSPDPESAAGDIVRRLDSDRTATRLASALPVLAADDVLVLSGWNGVIDRALSERADIASVVVRLQHDSVAETLRRRRTEQSVRVVDVWETELVPAGHALVPAAAMGPKRVLVRRGTADMLDQLAGSVTVWLVGGVGRILPPRLLDAIECAAADPALEDPELEVISPERFDRVVTERGVERLDDALNRFDCPIAPELLRPLD